MIHWSYAVLIFVMGILVGSGVMCVILPVCQPEQCVEYKK